MAAKKRSKKPITRGTPAERTPKASNTSKKDRLKDALPPGLLTAGAGDPRSAAQAAKRSENERHYYVVGAKRIVGQPVTRAEVRGATAYYNDVVQPGAMRVPQSLYRSMAGGRQTKQLQDLERKYGVPVARPVIDLYEVVAWFHDFLAENGPRLLRNGGDEDDALLFGESTPALERLRSAKADIAEMDAAQRRGELVDRQAAQQMMQQMAGHIRRAAEKLRVDYGEGAAAVVYEAVSEFATEIDNGNTE